MSLKVYGVGVEYGSQPEAGSEQRHAKIRKQIKPLTKCQSNFERAATAIESHPIIFEKVFIPLLVL